MNDLDRRKFLVRAAGSAGAFAFAPVLQPAFTPGKEAAALAVGVIGIGRQGRAILGELAKLPGVAVAGVCDPVASRLKAGQRRAREAKAFASAEAMLAALPALQAVVVATPTHMHKEPALRALEKGKHVYCEAPLASTPEDCRALARAARKAGSVFQVGLQARTNPIYKLAETFVRSGALREVLSLRGQWARKTSWRFSSGDPSLEKALNWRLDPEVSLGLPGEVASLQMDAVAWFLRQYPVSVRGSGSVRFYQDGREVADTVQLEFAFPDGVRMGYEATLGSSYEGRYELFRGSNATIRMADTFGWMFKEADSPTQGWEVYASRERFHNDEGITLIADATKLAKQGKLKEGIGLPHPPLYYALESFAASVAEGKPPVVSAEMGLRAAVIGIQAQQAVVTGKEMALPDSLYKAD